MERGRCEVRREEGIERRRVLVYISFLGIVSVPLDP